LFLSTTITKKKISDHDKERGERIKGEPVLGDDHVDQLAERGKLLAQIGFGGL
jgi:hypothetical protein